MHEYFDDVINSNDHVQLKLFPLFFVFTIIEGDGGNGTHVYLLDSGLFKGHVAFEGKEKLSFDARSEKVTFW